MELADELQCCLRDLSSAGPAELRENGRRIALLSRLTWEIRGDQAKPLLHLWSDNHNLTRRVLAIAECSRERLSLTVERFGRSKPDRLDFYPCPYHRPARELSREAYCRHLAAVCAQQFPDETLESLTIAPDLENSLSGVYARGVLVHGSLRFALLSVPDQGSAEAPSHCLTFALLWLERLRRSARRGPVGGLRLILPKAAVSPVAHLLPALDPRIPISLYEHDPVCDSLEKIDPRSLSNLDSWLVPLRETRALLDRALPGLGPILERTRCALALHPAVPAKEVWARFRGLPFARWEEGRVSFGVPEPTRELSPSNFADLESLLHELEIHRNPLASDTRHPLYRAYPERWLEALVIEDITRIDALLDPRFVYAQVFASTAGEHGILDLIGVTRSGRLAVLELKAGEHIHLPLQAANYWLRIRRHLEQGDFARCGYFPGIELQAQAPVVYLVAPALRFHPSTDVLLRYLTRELEVIRVGLAENWRHGLRVVLRQ